MAGERTQRSMSSLLPISLSLSQIIFTTHHASSPPSPIVNPRHSNSQAIQGQAKSQGSTNLAIRVTREKTKIIISWPFVLSMNLFSKAKAKRQHQRKDNPVKSVGSTLRSAAAPHPCQLKCKVKGPDGKQVALVPICLPLSIMASHAVKSAGGSNEVACLASVAVVAQANAFVSRMKTEALMTQDDVFNYVDTVARNTHHTIVMAVGDRHIADEVEAMIRGGGQLILKSNEEQNAYQESRDDDYDEKDVRDVEDAQSIATSVLNNFDHHMMGGTLYGRSEYASNDAVARNHSKVVNRKDMASNEKQSLYWFRSTAGDEDTTEKARTNDEMISLDNVMQAHSELHQPRYGPEITYNTTCETSNNVHEYETFSTFNLDTFHPVPSTFYQAIPHKFLGCPNLSMEPISDNVAPLASQGNQSEHVRNTDRSNYSMCSGRGIFAISSHVGIDATAELPSGRDLQNNTNHPHNNNTNLSVTRECAQLQMKRKLCTFDDSLHSPSVDDRARQSQNFPNDQESTSPYTYQSYIEPGKEVDEITFLNTPKEKNSVMSRVRRLFVEMSCKSG